MLIPAALYFAFSASIRAWASRNSGSSSASVSSSASRKSVNRPKYRLSSRFARKRTSSASTRSSMFCGSVSSVGTTTSVRDCAGMPAEKSMRGSGCGRTNKVASQFTRVSANWLVDSSASMPISTSNSSGTSWACASATRPALKSSVSSAIVPRYRPNGRLDPIFASVSTTERRTCALVSSSCKPRSIK